MSAPDALESRRGRHFGAAGSREEYAPFTENDGRVVEIQLLKTARGDKGAEQASTPLDHQRSDVAFPEGAKSIGDLELRPGAHAAGLHRDADCLETPVSCPAIATQRLSELDNGKLFYEFRKPWRDGTRGLSAGLVAEMDAFDTPADLGDGLGRDPDSSLWSPLRMLLTRARRYRG
ncbi:MAG: hypothetical protein V3V08_19650 [Nannocystaceae bacterium]